MVYCFISYPQCYNVIKEKLIGQTEGQIGTYQSDCESCMLTFNVKRCLCTIATILSIHYAFILPSVQYVQSLEEHAGNTSIRVPLQTNPTRGLQLFSIFKPNLETNFSFNKCIPSCYCKPVMLLIFSYADMFRGKKIRSAGTQISLPPQYIGNQGNPT